MTDQVVASVLHVCPGNALGRLIPVFADGPPPRIEPGKPFEWGVAWCPDCGYSSPVTYTVS